MNLYRWPLQDSLTYYLRWRDGVKYISGHTNGVLWRVNNCLGSLTATAHFNMNPFDVGLSRTKPSPHVPALRSRARLVEIRQDGSMESAKRTNKQMTAVPPKVL